MHWLSRILSYIREIHVESVASAINEELHLTIVDGRYQLSTNDAIYSWADKYANFRTVFEDMDLSNRPRQRVLVLGLGLASIPLMLQKMGCRYDYVGIEVDEQVIYLASKYVLDQITTDVTVIQTDARLYLRQCNDKFDIIAMDIFIGQSVPIEFWNASFVQQLKGILDDDGVLIYNTIARTPELLSHASEFYTTAFSPQFKRPTSLQIKGNMMLISNADCLRKD